MAFFALKNHWGEDHLVNLSLDKGDGMSPFGCCDVIKMAIFNFLNYKVTFKEERKVIVATAYVLFTRSVLCRFFFFFLFSRSSFDM